jgi:hypothetical protein
LNSQDTKNTHKHAQKGFEFHKILQIRVCLPKKTMTDYNY